MAAFFTRLSESLWIFFASEFFVFIVNINLAMALTFLALLALRPVTNRLIAPQVRVWLWFVGWYGCFLMQIYHLLGKIRLLPVSFRSLVIPYRPLSTHNWAYDGPQFLTPISLLEEGEPMLLRFPFGGSVSLPTTDTAVLRGILGLLGLVWLAGLILLSIWESRQNRRLRRLGQQGRLMDYKERLEYGVTQDNVAIRLCKNLPTSFVRFGNDTGWGDGIRFVICLQEELPPERLRLVLMHEMEHIGQFHAWWKSTMTGVLYVYFFNPVLWWAYRATCRDMELACDEEVMARLSEQERREYAHTLLELASGKGVMASCTSFAECDAALRIRTLARWKPRTRGSWWRSALLLAVLVLFFYTGSTQMSAAESAHLQVKWEQFVSSDYPLERLRRWHGEDLEIVQMWETARTLGQEDRNLLLVDQHGQWYLCWCVTSHNSSGYYFGSCQTLETPPDLADLVPIPVQ